MEEQVAQLLAASQESAEGPRKQAEQQLHSLWTHPDYAPGLVSIASHESVPINIRQSALLALKQFVVSCWSSQFDEFKGQPGDVLVADDTKARIRDPLLALATTDRLDRKLKAAASYAVSKIASADFPEQWPDLLQQLMHIIPQGTDGQLHGALKVLSDLVDDSFGEDQFFAVAKGLIKVIYDVAVAEGRKPTLRAFAVSVFRGCFDILETVMEEHKSEVKVFAEEILAQWTPLFIQVMKMPLPPTPTEQEENDDTPNAVIYKGLVALKLQVVKVLMRIRSVFPTILSPQTPILFQATWAELSSLQAAYHQIYIEEERQSRLEDADGLPYTLDFLVLEELDFMQACLRAPPVRAQLEQELLTQPGDGNWVTEVMKLAVAYAQITTEEEGLWDIDVNIFLSEETSVTANYTPRTACGDLVIKLGEWLTQATVDGLLSYTRSLYSTTPSWKAKEAALYILNQLLSDFQDVDKQIGPETAMGFVDFIRYAMQQPDAFLRARGFLVAGSLTRTSGDALQQVATSFLEASLHAITNDESDVVQVSCIRALQFYLQALAPAITQPLQNTIITAIATYLHGQDLQELAESDDLMVTLVETLRDAILLDTRVSYTGAGLDLLFEIASHGANNFQLTMLVNETFEEVTTAIASMGGDAYIHLCAKVLPSLNAALDIGNLTAENNLTNLAADLLALLAEHGPEPLPNGFIQATMPKLTRILLGGSDEELLKSATTAVKNIISHGHHQLFEWQSEDGKGGLEVVLIIIDRLLSTAVNDNAAGEVGALAAEIVEKAGSERLGPYLGQLLRAVAVRLGSATHSPFIQSLTLVFARLSLNNASEVVDFLADLNIDGVNGLQVVLAKWLENSINFAGYDEIRQKYTSDHLWYTSSLHSDSVIALSKLYDLKDPRIAQILVRGDLIVPSDGRIMTRSRARQSKPTFHNLQGAVSFFPGSPSNPVFPGYNEWLNDSAEQTPANDTSLPDPDQYTVVSAPLKILKVLIVELQSAAGVARDLDAAAAAELAEEGSDNDDWEDEHNPFVELSGGLTKEQLLAYAADDGPGTGRQRDDETQGFLVDFFKRAVVSPGFTEEWEALSLEEQARLRESAQ